MISGRALDSIVEACGLSPDKTVLEIGAGLGFLTERLARVSHKVIAVEKDRLFCSYLKEGFKDEPHVSVVEADILRYPFNEHGASAPLTVAGNIPYQLTSPLLEILISNRMALASVVLTIQKDVALRLTAKPGSRDRSALTCWMEMHADIHRIRNFPKTDFYPAPRVDSSLISIDFFNKTLYPSKLEGILRNVIHRAFQKKRKTILNAVSGISPACSRDKVQKALREAGIASTLRPESLTPQNWISLALSLCP